MPQVSVIMPVYNAEKYVIQSIESILKQTFHDFELILVDDCSTDSSLDLIKNITNDKVKVLQTPQNSGASISRNLGISHAQGKYIAFLDADDWSYPQRLEKQVNFLEANPQIGLIGTWAEIISEKGELIDEFVWEIPQRQIVPRLLFHNYFVTSSVMLRRTFALLLFDDNYPPAEDYELWRRVSRQTQLAIINEKLVKYLVHSQGISKRKEELMQKNRLKILDDYLLDLQITPTEYEIKIHQQIAHLDFDASKDFLKKANDWLVKLKRANERTQFFPKKEMNEVLADYWFKICSAHLGLGVFTLYYLFRSPLTVNFSFLLGTKLALLCLYSEIKTSFK